MSIEIILHVGASGASKHDTALDAALRQIAVDASEDPEAEWAEKYGTDFENGTFKMHPFCWCEHPDCPFCGGAEPNFVYKPIGFTVDWYKYIGRSTETEGDVDVAEMLNRCLESLQQCP